MWFVFAVLFLPFVFCCSPLCFFLGGGIHLFTLITSMALHQWPKNKIKPQKTPISEILFLMFCFGVCTLTLSPGPHNNRNPKPSTPENRIYLLHNALNPVLKCLFFTVFLNINQICPPNRPLTKTITLHNAQNKTECFRNGLLWRMKTFMLTKTHNWKNEKKQKTRKRDLKDKTKQETPQKQKYLMKRCLSNVIFDVFSLWNKRKETRQERTTKKQGMKK